MSAMISFATLITIVSYKQKYVHELLVKGLLKLAQEKVWVGEVTVPHNHSCWLGGRKATKHCLQLLIFEHCQIDLL